MENITSSFGCYGSGEGYKSYTDPKRKLELTEKLLDDEIQHRDLYIGKGRSSRYWSMEDVVEDKLKSIGLDINDFKTESKLLSPAQIEKKLKIYGVKLDLKDLQVKTEPKPKLKFVK